MKKGVFFIFLYICFAAVSGRGPAVYDRVAAGARARVLLARMLDPIRRQPNFSDRLPPWFAGGEGGGVSAVPAGAAPGPVPVGGAGVQSGVAGAFVSGE